MELTVTYYRGSSLHSSFHTFSVAHLFVMARVKEFVVGIAMGCVQLPSWSRTLRTQRCSDVPFPEPSSAHPARHGNCLSLCGVCSRTDDLGSPGSSLVPRHLCAPWGRGAVLRPTTEIIYDYTGFVHVQMVWISPWLQWGRLLSFERASFASGSAHTLLIMVCVFTLIVRGSDRATPTAFSF